MAQVDEEKVRELAYQLWEQNGSPEGRDEEFWQAAEKLLANEADPVSDNSTTDLPLAAIVGRTLK
jgi:hypothetical protein